MAKDKPELEDQAALNEEASQELAAMISEAESEAGAETVDEAAETYQIGTLSERMAVVRR